MFSTSLTRLLRDESGASAIEYGLLVALVSVLAVAGLDAVGSSLGHTISTANNSMNAN